MVKQGAAITYTALHFLWIKCTQHFLGNIASVSVAMRFNL